MYDERKYEGNVELTLFCMHQHLSEDHWKKWLQNQDYLGRKFSKNCCIHVKSQKTSVLQSLNNFKPYCLFFISNLFCNLHSHDHQNKVPSPTEPWIGPCDWHIHYLGLSYGVVSFMVKLLCCQKGIDRKHHWKHRFPVWMEWFYKKYRCQLLKMESWRRRKSIKLIALELDHWIFLKPWILPTSG